MGIGIRYAGKSESRFESQIAIELTRVDGKVSDSPVSNLMKLINHRALGLWPGWTSPPRSFPSRTPTSLFIYVRRDAWVVLLYYFSLYYRLFIIFV